MRKTAFHGPLVLLSSLALIAGCEQNNGKKDDGDSNPTPSTELEFRTDYSDWPAITSAVPLDDDIETKVAEILANMTLAEKVGQMVQPEIKAATPEDVIEYHLGSVLNGGGSWPNNNKQATAADWLALADGYWEASMSTDDGYEGIPLIWGTDAVHGHSNVFGATLFPHNIGLGAANDPDLIKRIGVATAKQVTVTGIDWTFAPTLAVVRDDRWGRTYEGYSEDGEIVFHYGRAMVEGLQGNFSEANVVATAKHFIGDGGTELGDDQGDNVADENELRNVHAQGYFSSLNAGVQTVMASFNSWNGEKLHGHEYLMNDVLKKKMGFDGFIVSDWNGIGQVENCSNDSCPQAINAGIDMIMVPNDWKSFIEKTIASVNAGDIPMERIDDAVTRILRVKFRAGLFDKPKPSERLDAGVSEQLATDDMRALAREAVRKSLVMLKNQNQVLPLAKTGNILVAGKSADSIENQTGGWTLTWQGTNNSNEEFPNADSIFAGIDAAVTAGGGTATLSADGAGADDTYDAIIAVIGETPYAEGQGDLSKFETMEFAKQEPADLQLLEDLKAAAPNTPIITLFVTGRPMWVNKELNLSDAFVSVWLPGSEGAGVADVIFGDHAFTGKLSFSWPAEDCQVPTNRGDESTPLFAYGFGLTVDDNGDLAALSEEVSDKGCGAPDISEAGTTNEPLNIFTSGSNAGDFVLRIGGPSNWDGIDVSSDAAATTTLTGDIEVTTEDGLIQFSAKKVDWLGTGQVYSQTTDKTVGQDLSPYANSEASLIFRVKVNEAPASTTVNLGMHCVYPCLGELNIASLLSDLTLDEWTELSIPLQCFLDDGLDITNVNTPFLIFSDDTMDLSIEEVRWEPWTAGATPDCSSIIPTEPAPTITTATDIYIDGITDADLFAQPGTWAANTDTWAEDPSYITLNAAFDDGTSTVIDARYGTTAARKGVVLMKGTEALDMSALATTGALQFDLKVVDLAAATGIVGKMVCSNDGNGCTTGDLGLTYTLNEWVTNTITFADFDTFEFSEVTSILEVLPIWEDNHNDVHFQIDNVRIVVP